MKKTPTVLLIITSIVGMIYSFNYFSKGSLTANEQVLFSIFLAIASFFLSWLISHYYYEVSHEESIEEIKRDYQANLKVYAQKAAEKVTNLSAEFTRLANYLREEFQDDEYESDHENLHAKKERIYSAIHIVNTLKSINDGSLSDWKGVIPEEIEEIAEEEREKVENISTILNQYRSVVNSSEEEFEPGLRDEDLKDDIRQLNKRLDLAINNILGTTAKPKGSAIKREKIEKECPSCEALVQYKQKPITNSKKWIKCHNCNTKLSCRWDPKVGFSLAIYDNAIDNIKNNHDNEDKVIIDENFIQAVKEKLPEQPWPKKITNSIAEEFKVSNTTIHRVTDILIKRGVFKHQIGGVIYVPESSQSKQ